MGCRSENFDHGYRDGLIEGDRLKTRVQWSRLKFLNLTHDVTRLRHQLMSQKNPTVMTK